MRKPQQRRSTLDMDVSRKTAFDAWDTTLEQLSGSIEAYVDKADRIHQHFSFLPPEDHPEASGTVARQDAVALTIEQGLLHLDSKLDHLVKLEEKLRATRVRLQGLRNTSITLSPINRLPPEILSLIIVLGDESDDLRQARRKQVQEDQGWGDDDSEPEEGELDSVIFGGGSDEEEAGNDHGKDDTIESGHFPTTISHVCKAWRQMAINTAKLWTRIDFKEGFPYEKTKEWIERSKQCEITVEMDLQGDAADVGDREHFEVALGYLEKCASRTTSLVLATWTIDELLTGIEHFTAGDQPPPLKSLTLCVEDADGEPVVPKGVTTKPQLFLDLMRGLEHVDFDRVYLSWGSETYRGLKTLRLANFSALDEVERLPKDEDMYAMLAGCPQLERLQLDTVWLCPDEDDDGVTRSRAYKAVQLPHLKTLHMTCLPLTTAHFLFSNVSAPHLERFILAEYGSDQTASSREVSNFSKIFPAFLNRIEPTSLKYIRIMEVPDHFANVHVIQCLTAAPGLEELSLENVAGVDDEVLNALLPPTSAVPNLGTLRISNCSEFSATSLKNVIQYRNVEGMTEGKAIRRLVVKYCTFDDADGDLEGFMREHVKRLVWVVEEEGDEVDEEEEGDTEDDD